MKAAALGVSIALVACPSTAQAQSAAKVIERHIDAIGGKDAVEKIVSTDLAGSVSSADGRAGTFTQRSKRPQLFSVSLSWIDSRWRAGFNGRAAWQDDPLDGVRTLYGQAASRVRAEASYANTRFMVPEKINRVEVTGRDQIRGRAVIVIVAITPDGITRTLFFDAKTYLLVKDQEQTDAGVEERPPIDDHVFDVPAAPSEPPLEIEALLSAAERNEQRAETVRSSYAYTQSLTTRRVDKQGRVKQDEGPT